MSIASIDSFTTGVFWMWALAALVLGIALISAAVEFFVANHSVRVARRQSIPTYYRQLAFSH